MRTHEQPKPDEYPSIVHLTWPGKVLFAYESYGMEEIAIALSTERIATIARFPNYHYILWVSAYSSNAKLIKHADWREIFSSSSDQVYKTHELHSPLEVLATAHHEYQQEQERIACQHSKTTTPTPSTTP